MPRAGLSADAVVAAAVSLVDARGPGRLTLAAVADATGVATPSLYKHIGSVEELFRLVAIRSMNSLADALTAAVLGRGGDDAVRALMTAYRDYALAFPRRYAVIPRDPAGDPDLAAAGDRVLAVILAVLRGYGLTGPALIPAARSVRAAAHGFASLQAAGAFGLGEDPDVTYDLLIQLVIAGLRMV